MAKGPGTTRGTNSNTAHGGNSSHPITGFTASEIMKQARINAYENYPLTQSQISQKLSEFDSRITKAEADYKAARAEARKTDWEDDAKVDAAFAAEGVLNSLKEGKKQFEMMYGPKVEKEIVAPKVRKLSNKIK